MAMLFRRLLAFILLPLLIVLVQLSLLINQANTSFLNPQYYKNELRKAEIYEFLLSDIPNSLLNDVNGLPIEHLPTGVEENPVDALGVSVEEIVASFNKAVPPEWVRAIVEDVIENAGGYLTGQSEEFQIEISAGERTEIAIGEFTTLIRKADAYSLLFDWYIEPAIKEALEKELPLGLSVPSDQVLTSVKRVARREWVHNQLEHILGEVTPYATGKQDEFQIHVQLADRAAIAIREIKRLLRDIDAYTLLYDDIVEPILIENLGTETRLPYNLNIDNQEVVEALKIVAPPKWVRTNAEAVIDQATPYITGAEDNFSLTIDISDNKEKSLAGLLRLTREKFNKAADALPPCTPKQAIRISTEGISEFPYCIPTDPLSKDMFAKYMEDLIVMVDNSVKPALLDPIPDTITFTDEALKARLRDAGAEDNIELVEGIRTIIRDGWKYTDQNLMRDAENSGLPKTPTLIRSTRAILSESWTYDQQNLRESIVLLGGDKSIGQFDQFRETLGFIPTLRYLVLPSVLLVILLIGLLAGQGWVQRIIWSSGATVVSAGIVFVIWGPAFSLVIEPLLLSQTSAIIDATLLSSELFQHTNRLVQGKSAEIVGSVVNGFASGIARTSMLIVLFGLAAITICLIWTGLLNISKGFKRCSIFIRSIVFHRISKKGLTAKEHSR